jgi:hypothetical protein
MRPDVFTDARDPQVAARRWVSAAYPDAAVLRAIARSELPAEKYIFTYHDKPYRVYAFEAISHLLSDGDYWHLLSQVYVLTENFHQARGKARSLMAATATWHARKPSSRRRSKTGTGGAISSNSWSASTCTGGISARASVRWWRRRLPIGRNIKRSPRP